MLKPCSICPTCNSKNIKRVTKDITLTVKELGVFIFKDIKVDKCFDCNEIVIDKITHEEMQRQKKEAIAKLQLAHSKKHNRYWFL